MDETQARNMVWIAGGLMFAAALIGPSQGSKYRRVWATGLATVILAGSAEFAPQVTGPLAVALSLVMFYEVFGPGGLGFFTGDTPAPSRRGQGQPGGGARPNVPA